MLLPQQSEPQGKHREFCDSRGTGRWLLRGDGCCGAVGLRKGLIPATEQSLAAQVNALGLAAGWGVLGDHL